ncbi:MAG: RDD family protein [Gammaproteobacteria bacterium]|nr:RDD family protein [Gammaproteobacteria bacterium]
MNSPNETASTQPASLFKRIASGLYDGMLIIALFVIPTLVLMAFRGGEPVPAGDPLLQILLAATAAIFFVYFWSRGGQTAGMRAWRLRVESTSGAPLSLKQAAIRFAIALPSLTLFGLGILWALIDKEKRTLPDMIAGTRVVVVPKK